MGCKMAKACQLFSGSKGNSIYISSACGKFLVDAGVSAKRLDEKLRSIGVEPDELDGIFVTHEHTDHIGGLRVFSAKHNLPVFAHKDVAEKIKASGSIKDGVPLYKIYENMEIGGAEIVPFVNSHDSVACVGYRFNMNGRSIAVCTDTGYVTDDAKEKLKGTDMVYLESNHEVTMLQNGIYPYPLKQRILSAKGHLSNFACGEFAKELVQNGTTRLVLAHLSKENNNPDVARQATLCALSEAGFEQNKDFRLGVSAEECFERPIVL